MDDIPPPLKCILFIEQALAEGKSVQTGLKKYIACAASSSIANPAMHKDSFSKEIQELLQAFLMNKNFPSTKSKTIYRSVLKDLLWSELKGQSIHQELQNLKEEIHRACHGDIKLFIDSIPIKSTLPLLLFQFPAFLMLLMGPLLTQILEFL